jgi:aminoglycoside 3-N-acetyltransferase
MRQEGHSKAEIVSDLRSLGLGAGDHVAVSVSYGNMGKIIGGPSTVLDSILDVIGEKGTLMMPTYSYASDPTRLQRDLVFNVDTSISYTGYITELLRLRPNSIRSRHPTSSVSAIGKYANFLTKNHDENKIGLLPYFRLMKIDGKYLSIGLDDRLLAIRHTGQILSGLYPLIPKYYATQYRKPSNEIAVFYDYFPCPDNLTSITPLLERKGIIKSGKIGEAGTKIGKAKDIIIETSKLLKTNPEMNLCDNPSCIWCRSLEKKLGLYNSIPKLKYYQQPFIREIIACLNKIRITRFNHLMFRDTWRYPLPLLTIYLYSRLLVHKINK